MKAISFTFIIFLFLVTLFNSSNCTEKHSYDQQKVIVKIEPNHSSFSNDSNETPQGFGRYELFKPFILTLAIATFLLSIIFLWSYTLHREVARKTAGLKKSEEKYRLLVESACEGIILINPDGTIAEANSKASEITGYSNDELMGKEFMPFFKKEDVERLPFRFDLLKSGKSVIFTRNVIRKDGTEVPVESITRMMPGNVLLVFCRDVTERLRMEECIRNSERLESLGILAGGIAHDFNNMHSGLFGYIHLSKELAEKDSKIETYLSNALAIHNRAVELTRRLLTFSRGGAPDKKPVDLKSVISSAISSTLKSTNINVTVSSESECIKCNADENQMNQVFKNLLVNSLEAMKNTGNIFINIKETFIDNHTILKKGNYYEIVFTDQGCGIPPDVIRIIFDPFFTTKQGRTGLGLTMVYSILKRHGGHIEAYSEDGKGASFTIYLPLPNAVEQNENISIQNLPENKNGENILIMDDDLHVRKILQILLKGLGYKVKCVSNGDSAIREFSDAFHGGKPFDLVILDLTIAGGYGGKEVIKSLKEIDPLISSIALSGYSNDPVMADPKSFHFSSRLKKPFLKDELSSTVRDVLEMKNT